MLQISLRCFLLFQLLLFPYFSLGVRRIPDIHWDPQEELILASKKRKLIQEGNDDGVHNNNRRVQVVPIIPESPDDHLVKDLPLLDKSKFHTSHWAGLLPASDDGHNYFFYWLFAPDDGSGKDVDFKNNDRSIPLLIWLNGGPGCSSMEGLWLENGPFRLKENPLDNSWSIEIDEYSWHTSPAFVLYVDQPVGTGISFTTSKEYRKNDEEVNVHFYYFLKQFLMFHKDKFLDESSQTLNRPLYFTGESHAGHYIPSIMNYIQKQNDAQSPTLQIPLAGAAIGNGWIDPPVQYSQHEAAYGKGIIGLAQKRALEDDEKRCQEDLSRGEFLSQNCLALQHVVIDNSEGKGSQYHISQYDARKKELVSGPRDFPRGHKNLEAFLGGRHSKSKPFLAALRDEVLAAIHSTPSAEAGQRYRGCSDAPFEALAHQDGLGVTQDVVDLLNNDVRMMFFNGIEDMICNHVGNEITVENFGWKLQKEYQLAKRYGWKSPSTQRLAGYMKEHKNLMFLKVKDGGHMVPMDVPDVALDMIRTFVYNKSFGDYEQRMSQRPKPEEAKNNEGTSCQACPLDDWAGLSSDDDDDDEFDEESGEDSDDRNLAGVNKTCPKCPQCTSTTIKIEKNGTPDLPTTWKEWTTTSPATLVFVTTLVAWVLAFCIYMVCFRRHKRKRRSPNGDAGAITAYSDKP